MKPLLQVLKGAQADVRAVWLMHQAGRYLPEYREPRAAKGGFLALSTDPEAAAEVTEPIRRFGFDGATRQRSRTSSTPSPDSRSNI